MLSQRLKILYFLLIATSLQLVAQTGQLPIPRIAQMPNQPAPYNLRNWQQVAVEYDNFVYDFSKTGEYLPLGEIILSGINYPQRPSFRLDTYVGTFSQSSREAVNILPSLVGATLAGVDKTDHYDRNWVLMSQDFFNKGNGENIYLNNAGARSGTDWWYDLMPNVFFYQLYDLYPDVGGEEDQQFITIADRFHEAVQSLGGSATPWQAAYFNYRAFNFRDQEPLTTGVPEPEAAGAYAYILYHAFKNTNNKNHLQAAEWSLEFLNNWNANPSYELMLPYGTLTAAKMNAEIGTDYNIEKFVNWSFDRGALRGWGTIVGNWGGFDVSGIVGEANDNGNDYAFMLNGLQQAAALVPMVRYDKRFARAIGKWTLNLANATRLFFPNFLPAAQQDASDWSQQYDPQQVIGYEALREVNRGLEPFSTGDPLVNGWGATNLSLYSTSSIGYLGAIVEETDVEQILQLDLLATDFHRSNAYPTYLYYNPYDEEQTVTIEVGEENVDVYDALTEEFLQRSVSGTIAISIPADEARMITFVPVDGTIAYDQNRMSVNGVMVDYQQSAQDFTYAPRIQALATASNILEAGDTTTIYLSIQDKDSDELTVDWTSDLGNLEVNGNQALFTAPITEDTANIRVTVTDEAGNTTRDSLSIIITPEINDPPIIVGVNANQPFAELGSQITFTATATDQESNNLTYTWSASAGTFSGNENPVIWTAPDTEGIVQITLTVTDEGGLSTTTTTDILVRNFESVLGEIIAHYPFAGNADDISGNELDGTIQGTVVATSDRLGNRNEAYYFNGGNQHIRVASNPILNVQESITVSAWFQANELPEKEVFLLSHGSWQNRWKLSITPDKVLRWTINTNQGITDLDTKMQLNATEYYHVSATYDGEWMVIYLNGALQNAKKHSGLIRTTTLPFLIAQMLPDNSDFNFKGIMDEVIIHDYPLTPTEVFDLYESGVTNIFDLKKENLQALNLYPNPTTHTINIEFPKNELPLQYWKIIDLNGRIITEGNHQNNNIDISYFPSGIYTLIGNHSEGVFMGRFIKK